MENGHDFAGGRRSEGTPVGGPASAGTVEAQNKRRTWIARRRQRAQTFWEEDWSLTALLVLLVGNLFVLPLALFEPWGRLIARGLMSLIIISGAFALMRSRQMVGLVGAIALALLLL
ncbi:MAG TPA: hypothetical protein VGI47_12590, partial [Candidatus Binataceae bacterium]